MPYLYNKVQHCCMFLHRYTPFKITLNMGAPGNIQGHLTARQQHVLIEIYSLLLLVVKNSCNFKCENDKLLLRFLIYQTFEVCWNYANIFTLQDCGNVRWLWVKDSSIWRWDEGWGIIWWIWVLVEVKYCIGIWINQLHACWSPSWSELHLTFYVFLHLCSRPHTWLELDTWFEVWIAFLIGTVYLIGTAYLIGIAYLIETAYLIATAYLIGTAYLIATAYLIGTANLIWTAYVIHKIWF